MVVIDTSAWIEWLLDSPLAGQIAIDSMAKAEICVPTIVQLELAKWLKRQISFEAAKNAIAFTDECVVIELDSNRALLAADLCLVHKLTTADSIIYACALEMDAKLLTCDSHFKGLENVVLFEKKGTLQ